MGLLFLLRSTKAYAQVCLLKFAMVVYPMPNAPLA